MQISDKIVRSAQPFLEPGETVRAAFLAQTFSQAWLLLSYWFAYFTKAYRCVVITDRRIIVLNTRRFNATKATGVHHTLPLTTALGSPTGTWWKTESLGEKLYIHQRHHQDIIAATNTSATVSHPQSARPDVASSATAAMPAAVPAAANPPGWHPDPLGRADVRWWSGTEWTSHVASDGRRSEDPPVRSGQTASADATAAAVASTQTRTPPSNMTLLVGIAVVALLAIAAIVVISRRGDDTVAEITSSSTEDLAAPIDDPVATVAPATVAPTTACADNVYVATDDGTLVLIDTVSNTATGTIDLGAGADGLAVTPSGDRAYVANPDANTVSVVDLAASSVVATVELIAANGYTEIAESQEPTAAAVTQDGTKAYVVSYYGDTTFQGGLWVIDTATGTVLTQVNLSGRPQDVVMSPDGSTAYVTVSEQAVFVIDTATDAVVDTIALDARPDGIALSPDGATAYVADSVGGVLLVIDTATRSLTATVAVGTSPVGVAVTGDGQWVYVSTELDSMVGVVDAATNALISTIDLGEDLADLAIAPDGSSVYVLSWVGTVFVIDAATNTVSAPIDLGAWPRGIAVCTPGA